MILKQIDAESWYLNKRILIDIALDRVPNPADTEKLKKIITILDDSYDYLKTNLEDILHDT